MAAFVRFVFTLIVVGMALNLAIVLLANSQSQRLQTRQNRRQAERLKTLLGDISGHVRRADVIIESQRVDGHQKSLESTLLVRQYRSIGTGQSNPLPVVRIVIPGNVLKVTGLMLECDGKFAVDAPEYALLRDTQLVFFGTVCGADEEAPAAANLSDERFNFCPRDFVPELVRLDPQLKQASLFEIKLWEYLWNLIPELPHDAQFPWVAANPTHGIKATWFKPATIAVRLDPIHSHTYSAFVSVNGLTLSEDEPGMPGLLDAMLDEGKKLDSPLPPSDQP